MIFVMMSADWKILRDKPPSRLLVKIDFPCQYHCGPASDLSRVFKCSPGNPESLVCTPVFYAHHSPLWWSLCLGRNLFAPVKIAASSQGCLYPRNDYCTLAGVFSPFQRSPWLGRHGVCRKHFLILSTTFSHKSLSSAYVSPSSANVYLSNTFVCGTFTTHTPSSFTPVACASKPPKEIADDFQSRLLTSPWPHTCRWTGLHHRPITPRKSTAKSIRAHFRRRQHEQCGHS